MLEAQFQRKLIKKLEDLFPGCIILKNDPNFLQGFPDLIILHGAHWAVLEDKAAKNSRRRPNQEYYIGTLNRMSFAAFIYPENEEEILNELQLAFAS